MRTILNNLLSFLFGGIMSDIAYNEKRKEEKRALILKGLCPQCKGDIKEQNDKLKCTKCSWSQKIIKTEK